MAGSCSDSPLPSTESEILLVPTRPLRNDPPPPYPTPGRTRRARRQPQLALLHNQVQVQDSDNELSGEQRQFPVSHGGEDHDADENTPLLAPRNAVRRHTITGGRARTVSHTSTVYSNVSGSPPSLARTLFSAFHPDLDSDIDGNWHEFTEEDQTPASIMRGHDLPDSQLESDVDDDRCALQDRRQTHTKESDWKTRWKKYFRPMWRRPYYSAVLHLLVLNFPFALVAWVYLFVATLAGTTLLMVLPLGALLCFFNLLGARLFARAELALQSTFHGPLAYTPYPARPIFYRLRQPTLAEIESGTMVTHASFFRNAYGMFTDATTYQALFYFLVIKPSITVVFGLLLLVLVPLSFALILPAPAILRVARRLGIWQANVAVEGLYLAVR